MRNLLYAFFVLFSFLSFGQVKEENASDFLDEIVHFEKSRAAKKLSFKANPNTTNYDLKYHRLEWSVDPRVDIINGSVTSYFVAGENLNRIVFDLADNSPLRSGKQDIYEGGIRVPFCVQWKGHLPENTVYNQPVISLDILPTAIAASVGDITYSNPLDGVNLLPFVLGEEQSVPHDALYWRFLWHSAIRDGDWKLLKHRDHPEVELYNLANDIGETYDLSKELPEVVMRLQAKYEQWNSTLMDPQWSWQPDYGGSYKVEKK
jgi:hypothetical protein